METRRAFVQRLAAVAGTGGAYTALQVLGFIPEAGAYAGPPRKALRAGAQAAGKGRRVVILGAGMAGLVSAHELTRAGYNVVVLEARAPPGGRVWTVRGGDRVEHTHLPTQTCTFDTDLYFNAGAARIPATHYGVHGYCRELGIALEAHINVNRSAKFHSDQVRNGEALANRRVVNDTRGGLAELLAKAVNRGALDDALTADDRERLLAFLKPYGSLTEEFVYEGSARSGYRVAPTVHEAPSETHPPVPLTDIIREPAWSFQMSFGETLDQQATMMQPVGGMDQLPRALAATLDGRIRYGAQVSALKRTGNGVQAIFTDAAGTARMVEADYAICTLPMPIVQKMECDLSPTVQAAVDSFAYGASCKVAWQSERFWEREEHLFGGISWAASSPAMMTWYPSDRFHYDRGVLIGAYNFGDAAHAFGTETLARQFAQSRAAVDCIHPGKARRLERPLAINWFHVPHSMGAWAAEGPDVHHDPALMRALLAGDGPVFFAGQHLSPLGAWMEAAVRSAHDALNRLGEREAAVSL